MTQQNEPVAWQWLTTAHFRKKLPKDAEKGAWNPLYTTPQQRTWVGLTDEEIQAEWLLTPQHDKAEGLWFGRRLEAKLKEKNT